MTFAAARSNAAVATEGHDADRSEIYGKPLQEGGFPADGRFEPPLGVALAEIRSAHSENGVRDGDLAPPVKDATFQSGLAAGLDLNDLVSDDDFEIPMPVGPAESDASFEPSSFGLYSAAPTFQGWPDSDPGFPTGDLASLIPAEGQASLADLLLDEESDFDIPMPRALDAFDAPPLPSSPAELPPRDWSGGTRGFADEVAARATTLGDEIRPEPHDPAAGAPPAGALPGDLEAGSRLDQIINRAGAAQLAGRTGASDSDQTAAETGLVDSSAGDMIGPEPTVIPDDPKFGRQWHLDNGSGYDINVTSVWDDYTGQGVVVGVIDNGIDYLHQDLDDNYNHALDYDARDKDSDAYSSDSLDVHGTAVAGVIAAEMGNDYGAVGVAPDAQIAGFRIGYGSKGSGGQVLDALQHQTTVDISNNSWKYSGFFTDNFQSASFASMGGAIEDAVTYGRDGLGTVFVFAGGNDRGSGDNVNYHNFQNSQYTIAVGGLTSNGTLAGWSNPGAALLLSAPAVSIYTTDRPGSLGYSSGDFASVSGTSFAAPVVSGVVALMLEANPDLGYRDVQEILAYSAVKSVSSDSGWQVNGATNWNGGGLTVSHDYGFGAVDALAAVRLAETWTDQSTITNLSSITTGSSPFTFIGDNTTITDAITIDTSNLLIDHVEVLLDLSHTYIGQLIVTLTSPDGTTSVLVDEPGNGGASQDNIKFTLDSVQFWGETGEGTWTLSVTDTASGDTGRLNSWTLSLFGDTYTGDDTYIYTNEFAGFSDPDRKILSDEGGIDTINASPVTADILLDLTPGATSKIAGNTLTIALGTVIENAYLGDGDDLVYGNDADNLILGGRGDDTLYGGAGFDTALYFGAFENYTVFQSTGGGVIVDFLGIAEGMIDEGTDLLFDFEALSFDSIIYYISDLLGLDPNTPPEANDDAVSMAEDTAVTIDVLANDGDIDGDALSASIESGPANGMVIANPDGTFTYTPNTDFNGTDSFAYSISDGHGGTDTATVSVAVTPVNDAPTAADDTVTTAQGAPVTIVVLANDGDVDGDALSPSLVSGAANGGVTLNAGGTFTYTPDAGFAGTDSFTYSVSDGKGGSATATVSITVESANAAPVARDDSAATDEDTAVTIDVLANDEDADGDPLSASIASGPANGTVIANPDGTFTYTPNADFNGTDSFTYSLSDGQGGGATATVSVAVAPVNDAPNAVDDTVAAVANMDTSGQGGSTTFDVLANDSDPDGDPLNASLLGDASHGTVLVNPDGTFTYTPDTGFTGADSFTYSLSDGKGASDWATVTVSVSEANAITGTEGDDRLDGTDGGDRIFGLGGGDRLYGHDGDDLLDGGAGNDVLHGGAGDDVLIGGAGAERLYGGAGRDVFRYQSLEDRGDQIRDFERGQDVIDISELLASLGYTGSDPVADGYLMQVYSGRGRALQLKIDPDGAGGGAGFETLVTLYGTGSAPLEIGTDILVASAGGTPPANDPPVAADDSAATDEDMGVVIDVLANDSDPDGDSLKASIATGPAHGALIANPDGTFTYTPEADFNGVDSFTYSVSDGKGGSDTASVTVTVAPVNDAPVAADDQANTQEDTPVSIDVLANDTDADGDALTTALRTEAAHGAVAANPDGSYTYTPEAGFIGTDSFTYSLSDGKGGSDWATVSVTVGAPDTIVGTEGNDTLAGTEGADHILGLGGNDRLYGYDGDDVLIGGAGADRLYGGAGSDVFRYESLEDSGDHIFDFTPGEDVIDLRDLLSDIDYTGSDPEADGFLQQVVTDTRLGQAVQLQIDPDGAAGPAGFQTLATVYNLSDLLDTGADILL